MAKVQELPKQESYKLHIPKEVKMRIDYICLKLNNIEWSGTLFYTVTGSIKDKDLVVNITDFLPQDIGSSAATEFTEDPEFVSYMIENDLLDCYRGLIHSHHTMATFFSGTDEATLLKESANYDHFVSLIVNNAGVYSAKMTTITHVTQQVREFRKRVTFEGLIEDLGEETFDAGKDEVTVNPFIIDIEGTIFTDLNATITSLQKKSAERAKTAFKYTPPVYNNYSGHPAYQNTAFQDWLDKNDKEPICATPVNTLPFNNVHKDILQITPPRDYTHDNKILNAQGADLFETADKEGAEGMLEIDEIVDYESIEVDSALINLAVTQILSGCVLASESTKLKLNTFIPSMKVMYDKRFEDIGDYAYYLGHFLDFLMYDFKDPFLVTEYSEDALASINAYFVYKEFLALAKQFGTNEYLDIIIIKLNEMIVYGPK